ncbi:hypothetical protein AVEN_91745-1 [Araneus ventricosus]|uniref:Integrase catalytic domain-containing protein n=1 Tax=Araneus ventricosus TaxID=182803 RepID=A0A4Y2V7J2_ARAVE|nr:hypothetical protein AVEN_91745-1 [Araneus ventricosus]
MAGPLFLCEGCKVWIVLFTCAVYPTIHLELVASLSAETFMQALRRIWARRGRGSTLYTDNSTNFTGAANTLKTLDWDFIQRECAVMKIKWLFSPPSAPWYGGFGERMIRCVKELLRKCLGRACTYIHNPRRPTHPKSLESARVDGEESVQSRKKKVTTNRPTYLEGMNCKATCK